MKRVFTTQQQQQQQQQQLNYTGRYDDSAVLDICTEGIGCKYEKTRKEKQ
jgi:hypothetical protein